MYRAISPPRAIRLPGSLLRTASMCTHRSPRATGVLYAPGRWSLPRALPASVLVSSPRTQVGIHVGGVALCTRFHREHCVPQGEVYRGLLEAHLPSWYGCLHVGWQHLGAMQRGVSPGVYSRWCFHLSPRWSHLSWLGRGYGCTGLPREGVTGETGKVRGLPGREETGRR